MEDDESDLEKEIWAENTKGYSIHKKALCPNKDCNTFGKYMDCYIHSYCLCDTFKDFYDKLSDEEKKNL